jgi:plasmid stability protein
VEQKDNPKKYVERLVVLERPDIAARLRQRALEEGHSVGAEVRQAVRAWLRIQEGERSA